MKNELLHIGPLTLYGYGLMIGLGILAAWILAGIRAKRQGRTPDQLFSMILWILLGGFAGAKLLFLLTQWKNLMQYPSLLRYYLSDGFVVFGGIIGGIAACFLFCSRKKLSFLSWFDFLMPSVALGQAFGRMGCLLAGCCYGKECHGSLSIVFHNSDYAPNGVPLIPTQLYSAFFDAALVLVLLRTDAVKKKNGETAAAYLLLYSVGRFVIEFMRGDVERGFVGFLSTSQFVACFTFLTGLFMMIRLKRD